MTKLKANSNNGGGVPGFPGPLHGVWAGLHLQSSYDNLAVSNWLKSLGLPLPLLAFMHWPTR